METDVKASNTGETVKIKEEPIQTDDNSSKTRKVLRKDENAPL